MSRSAPIRPLVPLGAGFKASSPPPLPALVAREMLASVLGTNCTSWCAGCQVTLLVLPNDEWARPVRDAWTSGVRGGREPTRLGLIDQAGLDDWTCVQPDTRSGKACEAIKDAAAAGVDTLVLTTPDAADLELLRAAADRCVVVPAPEWSMLVRAAGEALPWQGALPPEPTAHIIASITPDLLVMAARREDSAGSYLTRVISIARIAAGQPTAAVVETRGLARVPGLSAHVEGWARCLVRDLQLFKCGGLPWSQVDRGVVLAGEPGTGKSTLARALAEEAGVSFVASSYADWQGAKDGHLGSTLAAMRGTFARARAAAPCILLIDEVDSFPNRSRVAHDYKDYVRSVVNALLYELDGPTPREGVIVVGTCNDPSLLDPALVRPGRLERVLHLQPPDRAGVEAALRLHLAGDLRTEPLADIAFLAHGLTGAEVEMSVRAARRSARSVGRAMLRGDLFLAVASCQQLEFVNDHPLQLQ